MEQDQSRKNSGILDDQSRMLHLHPHPPNLRKHKMEVDDAINADDHAYELRENPKKSLRFTIIHRSFESASNVQERSVKWNNELESVKPHTKNQSVKEHKCFPCQICKSKFNSVRALNGHMRIHSARTAITPSTSEHVTLPKKKRSKPMKRDESQYRSQFSEEEIQLAETLLTLSTAGLSSSPSQEQNQGGSDQALSGSSSERELKFRCKICDRRFASYQQLGGHQTSHRMSKGAPVKEESTSCNNCEEERQQISVDCDSGGWFAEKVFNCQTCGRVFGSGQALGGHKRAHWDKEKDEILQGIVPSLLFGKNTSFGATKLTQLLAC